MLETKIVEEFLQHSKAEYVLPSTSIAKSSPQTMTQFELEDLPLLPIAASSNFAVELSLAPQVDTLASAIYPPLLTESVL